MSRRERIPLAVSLIAVSLVATLAISTRVTGDVLLVLFANSFTVELWIATAAVVLALFARAPLRSTLGLERGRLSARELALLALGTLAASHALDGALELSGLGEESVLRELPGMLEGARGLRLLAAAMALALAPGIAEELLCRGLIQRGLARRFGARLAIPAGALLFGLLHVEPIHAGFATILGLYLGAAAYFADSTRAPIVCHTLNNLAAVGLAAWVGSASASAWTVVAGGAVAIACLWAVGRVDRAPVPRGQSRD